MVEQITLDTLHEPDVLRRSGQAAALVIGVIEHSTFGSRPMVSFRDRWRAGASLFHLDNYSGDDLWAVFSADYGTLVVGYDHESDMNHYSQTPPLPRGVLDGVPAPLALFLGDTDFTLDGWPLITFCIWRAPDDTAWRCSDNIEYGIDGTWGDGSSWMLGDHSRYFPATAQQFVDTFREQGPPAATLEALFTQHPLTEGLIDELIAAAPPVEDGDSPAPTRDDVLRLALSIGYPAAPDVRRVLP